MNTLDTLEKKLSELKNRDPDETIRIGTYILRHSSSDRQKSSTLACMSFAYFAKKDAQKFTELLFRSKEIADQTKDPEIIAKINGTIAQMYLVLIFVLELAICITIYGSQFWRASIEQLNVKLLIINRVAMKNLSTLFVL